VLARNKVYHAFSAFPDPPALSADERLPVPIALRCACGVVLRTADDSVGKRVRCPKCSALLAVPARGITTGHGGGAPARPAPEPLSMDAVLAGPRPGGADDEDVVMAELADDEDIKTVELAEDEEFEVLESARDLPEVRRARKRRRAERAPQGPVRRSPEHDLYQRRPSILGMDVGESAKTVIWLFAVLILCCFVLSLVLGLIGRLLRIFG
jgi:hypothetical protein